MNDSILSILKSIKHFLFKAVMSVERLFLLLSGKTVIYVFGDSHTLTMDDAHFDVLHVGPATAFKLGSINSTTMAAKKIDKKLSLLSPSKKHYFLFVFGEIDCRIHINKVSRESGKTIGQVIKTTVSAYGKYLLTIKQRFPGSVVMVFNVLPPGEEKNIYNVKDYPTRNKHMQIVLEFNKQLQAFCLKEGFIFITLFAELLDKKGVRRKEYIHDPVHFNKKIQPFILDKIKYSLANL